MMPAFAVVSIYQYVLQMRTDSEDAFYIRSECFTPRAVSVWSIQLQIEGLRGYSPKDLHRT